MRMPLFSTLDGPDQPRTADGYDHKHCKKKFNKLGPSKNQSPSKGLEIEKACKVELRYEKTSVCQTSKTKFYKHQPKKLSRFELSKKRKKRKKRKKS